MLGIFDDERRQTEPIWPSAAGTRTLVLLDIVAEGLKWRALPRFPRLASSKRDHANAAITSVHRP